ncbi:hypothetical protein A2U01_0039116, partial [Trifolium medium]|nr:hypothetical protein [Trifolium medium]
EDGLVFPFNINAEVEALKANFEDAIREFGDHIKSHIEGRGLTTVQKIMEFVEKVDVKRLTLILHSELEEEKQRLEE